MEKQYACIWILVGNPYGKCRLWIQTWTMDMWWELFSKTSWIVGRFGPATLYFYNNEPSNKKNFLILLSSLASDPDWEELLKFWEVFLRKSQFSTLTNLNPGFGGHWDMLGIFLVNITLTTLRKKSFIQKKKNLNSRHRFKRAILAIFQFWQYGTFEPLHGIQIFLGHFFWKKLKFSYILQDFLSGIGIWI